MHDYPSRPVAALLLATDRPDGLKAAPSAGLRIGQRVGASLPMFNPDTGAPLPMPDCPFSAIVVGNSIPALRDLVRHAAADIDLAASVLLVGTEYTVKPGDGGVLVAMLVRRRADHDVAAFAAGGWTAMPRLACASRSRAIANGMPIRRPMPICLSPTASTARADPAIARDATRDEMQFIDHARSMLAMFRFTD